MILPSSLVVTWRARATAPSSLDQVQELLHRWVSGRVLDDILVDVADYRHVPQGPGLFVIGHSANYQLRVDQDTWEFSCQQKPRTEGDLDPLRSVFERSVFACHRLETDLKAKGLFDPTRVRIGSYDRRFWDLTERPLSVLSASIEARLGPLLLSAPRLEIVTGGAAPALAVSWTAPRTFDELNERIAELASTRADALRS